MGFLPLTQLVEDGLALPAPVPCRYGSSEDDFIDSEDMMNGLSRTQPATVRNLPFADSELMTVPMGRLKQEFKRRSLPHDWIHKRVCISLQLHRWSAKLLSNRLSL